jgi:hypothetical protein
MRDSESYSLKFLTRDGRDLFYNNDLIALDLGPLYVLLVLVTVFCVRLLDMHHLNLVSAIRAKVPETGRYFHVAPASITRNFHLPPPRLRAARIIEYLRS